MTLFIRRSLSSWGSALNPVRDPLRGRGMILTTLAVTLVSVACGGSAPPPETTEAVKDGAPRATKSSGGGAAVSQELGSIDQRAVEQTLAKLETKLETCHKQGRDRVEYLSGDMKVFLRIGQDGRVKYSYFTESTVGDRDTEKCILDLFGGAQWPKPQGGEAEVRNGFGWSAGGERQPAAWTADKVSNALEEDKDAKTALAKCKEGISGDFHVTAYVEPGDVDGEGLPASKGPSGGGKKSGAKGDKKAAGGLTSSQGQDRGGKFKSIGVAPPSKEGAEKIDCIVDALKPLSLPSPGSYAAKVSFSL